MMPPTLWIRGDFYSVSEGVLEAENMELHAANAKRKGDNSGRF